MPPKAKITKQMILESALQLVREEGHEAINARTLSERLQCSTQPIMYNFKTIEEIRQETYKLADEFHSRYVLPKGEQERNPLMELGLNYIRFGYVEKHLFKFLFQTNQFAGNSMDSLLNTPALHELLQLVSDGVGCEMAEAKDVFLAMFITAHGCASLLANNAMEYDEEQLVKLLKQAFSLTIKKNTGGTYE